MFRVCILATSIGLVLGPLAGDAQVLFLLEPTELVTAIPPLSETELAALPRTYLATCVMWVGMENYYRVVSGPVNKECGCAIPPGLLSCPGLDDCHTCWWGNWGAQSRWDSARDTNQFMGWAYDDGQWKWNSCTDDCEGDCYNYGNQQRSTLYSHFAEFEVQQEVEDELACSELDGISLDITDVWMKIYEMDGAGSKDFVNRLGYPIVRITLSCTEDECEGQSSWYNPSSNQKNNCTAKVRGEIQESYYRSS